MKPTAAVQHHVKYWDRRAAAVLTITVALAASVAVGLNRGGPSNYLVAPGSYTVSGVFVHHGAYSGTGLGDCGEAADTGMGSWGGSDTNTGTLATAEFRTPEILNFCLAGYPGSEGIKIYLENGPRTRVLELKPRWYPGEQWLRVAWELPPAWRGKVVRLVVVDRTSAPGGWVGITPPREGDSVSLTTSFGHAGLILAAMICQALLFILPGFCAALAVHCRVKLDSLRLAAVALLSSAAVGYAAFWVYFTSVAAGKVFSVVVLGGSAGVLTATLIKHWPGRRLFRELAIAVGGALLVAAFYLSLGYLYRTIEPPDRQAQNRILWPLPPDNVLPYLVSERIYLEQPLRPFVLGFWKSSDRPPLQSGLSLAQYPAWHLFPRSVHYQLLAVFLQSLWMAALWIFLRCARVRCRSIIGVMGLCIFSGFFFLHSYYVWPKLLAAAMMLLGLAFTPMARPAECRWSRFDITLAALGTVLAMLSHTGVVLAGLGIAVLLLTARQIPPWKLLGGALVVVVLLWLPWMLYQKLYDPPGDMLLKLHFAGSTDLNRSFGTLLSTAYGGIPVEGLISSKLENFKILFVAENWQNLFCPAGMRQWLEAYQKGNFFCLFETLMAANLGFLALLVPGWRDRPAEVRLAVRVIAAALISIAVWCLVMYTPGSAVIHQGSLLNVLFLFVGTGLALAHRWPKLFAAVVVLHSLVAFPIFVVARRLINESPVLIADGSIDAAFASLAIGLVGIMVLCSLWAEQFPSREPLGGS